MPWLSCSPARPKARSSAAGLPTLEKGTFHFKPVDDQSNVPERYRLGERTLDYELTPKYELSSSGVKISHLRFPSPAPSPHPENNTVHADYYRPKGPGPFPAVIVLDITAGDQLVSRTISADLAQHRIAALFVQMAYYGPRRPPGSKLRLVSLNFAQTMDAVRQTVLDIRCASAWLEARPEVDKKRLGVVGTSLGSFMGTLAAEMEPRLNRVVVLLGGGGLVDAYYYHPQATAFREFWEALGGTKEKLALALAPVDPLTCAANLKDHKVLMIAGKRDDIVPPRDDRSPVEGLGPAGAGLVRLHPRRRCAVLRAGAESHHQVFASRVGDEGSS